MNGFFRDLLAPSVLIGIAMLIFQGGVYVGRGAYDVLDQRLKHHESSIHPAGMSRSEIMLELRQLRSEVESNRTILEQQLKLLQR